MLANLIEGVDGYLPTTVSLLAENQLPRLIPLALLEFYMISGSIDGSYYRAMPDVAFRVTSGQTSIARLDAEP